MRRSVGRIYDRNQHEKHHIHPRALGGDNSKNNIAYLTYREHFLAHWLLTKFTVGKANKSMLYALRKMQEKSDKNDVRDVSSWQFELARKAGRAAAIENTYSKGRTPSLETREKLRRAMLGKTNRKGQSPTAETRKKLRLAMLGKKNAKGVRRSKEFIKNLQLRTLGNKYGIGNKNASGPRTKDFCDLIRLKSKGNTNAKGNKASSKPIRCVSDGREYPSIRSAAKTYGINELTLGKSLRDPSKPLKSLKFEFI